MMHEEAFNRDTDAQEMVRQLIRVHGIQTIVETGTYHGITTAYLATLGLVHTIEANRDFLAIALANWGVDSARITSHLGDSRTILPTILPKIARPVFFFLDAHWGYDHPLLGELRIIGTHGLDDSVIMIHDFLVPGTNLGYDYSSTSQPLSLEYIKPQLLHIYPHSYQYQYNSPKTAAGSRRGIIYIESTPHR